MKKFELIFDSKSIQYVKLSEDLIKKYPHNKYAIKY